MRDNINVNSSLKLFESYRDFGGGLNTQQSNELMKDNQVTISENVDLALTNSIKKRSGRTLLTGTHTGWAATSPIQGLFKFVNNTETILIAAVEGKLWYSRPTATNYGNWTQISITDAGSPFTFQTTDYCEAVQYGEWLYVATGSKLVRCQVYQTGATTTATAETVVDQFKPTSQEALYIGLNALNTNPAAYLVDLTTATTISIEALGIYCDKPTPAINQSINFTAYRKTNNNSPTDTDTDYEWYYRKSGDTTWTTVVSYGVANANKTYAMTFDTPNSYDIRVKMRLTNHHSINDEYIIFGLVVSATPAEPALPYSNIQRCRRILLHWDRLVLYDPRPTTTDGLTNQQDQIFISQVGEPRYFPTPNVISFSADTQQRVRKVVRYRNILLIFTPDTVQSLAGKSPDDYVRSLVNNQVGAIWGNSVQVVENDVFFVSKQGIYAIRPNVYTQDNFNVAGLDVLIQDQFADEFIATDAVTSSGSASAQVQSTVFESQYIIYGLNGKIYRHYYDRRAWVTDTMSHLVSTNQVMRFSSPVIASFNGVQTLIEPMIKYNTSTSVVVSTDFTALDKSVYTDNGVAYTMKLRTKYFDLSQAFNFKKLRQLFIIARLQDDDVALSVTVQADSDVILTPDSGYISVDPLTGATTWVTTSTPNFNFYAGTILYTNFVTGLHPLGENTLAVLKTSIRAKCRRVRLEFKHTDGSECEIYGFGLEFRSKKP